MPLKKFKKLPAKKKTNFISQKITNILKILTIIDSGERVTTPNLSRDNFVSSAFEFNGEILYLTIFP
ncbi:MAG: hypothetical protein A3H37_04985 [Candidatus Schekmanbacteria bacterium RIFCSPLOWO2_02_FULL_38_14]|nr:MAG: hypothetical protein A3H37_04985 [Candidatus Schekmanbacteria bacterium RIFCSPLOWO2_02_FULL_38_14]